MNRWMLKSRHASEKNKTNKDWITYNFDQQENVNCYPANRRDYFKIFFVFSKKDDIVENNNKRKKIYSSNYQTTIHYLLA